MQDSEMHEATKDALPPGQVRLGEGRPAGNLAPGVRFQGVLL